MGFDNCLQGFITCQCTEDPKTSTLTHCFSRALHFHPVKVGVFFLVQRVHLMREQRQGKKEEKAGENKKTQTKANFENSWEMEVELGFETFLFVSVQAEKAIKLLLVPSFHWPQLSFLPII